MVMVFTELAVESIVLHLRKNAFRNLTRSPTKPMFFGVLSLPRNILGDKLSSLKQFVIYPTIRQHVV